MGDLKRSFFSGVLYTGIAKYSGIIISIVVTAILARLISVEDFGIVAIATILVNFFSTLTTVGISPAIVQNKTITDDELKSINSFSFVIAIVVCLLYTLLIPLILSYYDNNEKLQPVLYLLVINIFFPIAAVVPNAMILKDKLFKFFAQRTLFIQLVLGIISVICAYYGLGIYSLLINPLGGSIILLIVNFCKYPIGFAKITKVAIGKILSFSLYQTLFNLLYLGYRNLDKFFVGKYFGMNSLGYYEKSYRLMMMPLENVSSVVSPVLHPLLSEHQNNPSKIWEVYLKMLSTLSEVCFVLSVFVYFIAEPLILIMYGDNWLQAVPIFKILSLSICFQIMQVPVGPVLQSINKAKGLFWSSCWLFIFVIVSIVVSICLDEINYLAWGIVISFALGFVVYQVYIARYFESTVFFFMKIISKPIFVALIYSFLCFLLSIFIVDFDSVLKIVFYSFATLIFLILLYKINYIPNTKDLILSFVNKKRFSNA